jgi:hypothetical protein
LATGTNSSCPTQTLQTAAIAIEQRLNAQLYHALTWQTERTTDMAVRWDPANPEDCKKLAEDRAGPNELGYLYRLYWSRVKESIRLVAYPILKVTPKCWKIQPKCLAKPIYVSMAKPYYAQPEMSQLLTSYRERRQSMVKRCEFRLREAQRSLAACTPNDPLNELYWLQDEFAPSKADDEELKVEEELV